MFSIVVVTSVLAAMAIAAMFANSRPDHPARRVIRGCGRIVVAYGLSIARMRYPEQFITDETRYEAWLFDHSATLPESSDESPASYGALGV